MRGELDERAGGCDETIPPHTTNYTNYTNYTNSTPLNDQASQL